MGWPSDKRSTPARFPRIIAHVRMMMIYFMHYNFVRIHETLKVAPAMAEGVTSKLWEMSDMVKVIENWEAAQRPAYGSK